MYFWFEMRRFLDQLRTRKLDRVLMRVALITTDNRENDRNYAPPTPYFGSAVSALLAGLSQCRELEVHVLSCAQREMTSPEKLAENMWFHSIHVPKIGWLRTGYQGCIRALRRKVQELNPAVVHGQGTERECALGAMLSGFPNVITIHGNMRLIARVNRARPFSYQWLAARLEGITVPRVGGVICISEYTRKAVLDEAARTWVLPNAVDPAFFEVQHSEPGDVPVILCVGHIQKRKNFNLLIQTLDSLAARSPLRLLIAGGFSDETSYVEEFRSLVANRPWCEHVGPVPPPELRRYLSSVSFLVLPSLEDNCPMVVLEALAAGVPVVATRVGGVPELVDHGNTGLLCETESASLLAGIERMLASKTERERMGERGRAEAVRRFHPKAVALRHMDIYREVACG